jgi:hypothetical protein
VLEGGRNLELLHKTQVEGIPGALAAFKGRLLAGVGPVLRLYELGKKKLLRPSPCSAAALIPQSPKADYVETQTT